MTDSALPQCIISGVKLHREEGRLHIDVRGLEPPEPLVAILSIIDPPDFNEPLTVIIDREPIYLYRELVERCWNWKLQSADQGRYVIQLTKAGR